MLTTDINQLRVKKVLQRAVMKERIAHAYLFEGKKGSGKKRMAAYFAQSLFCQQQEEGQPCLECLECTRIQHRNHPDVHWVEPEETSIKIEQIRQLHKEFSYRSHETNRKVYIVDKIETITTQAANSLLKFLEEPHPGSVALLLTEQRHQLLPTLISRCQEIKFIPPSPVRLIENLAPQYGEALAYLASHITTDMEEAVHLCQAEWFAELRKLVIQLAQEVNKGTVTLFVLIQDKWITVAKEKKQTDIGLELLLLWYLDLLYVKTGVKKTYVYRDHIQALQKQAQFWSEERITGAVEAVLQAKRRLHANVNPQLLLEQLMLRLQEG